MNIKDAADSPGTPKSRQSWRQTATSPEFWVWLTLTAVVAGITVAVIFMNWSSWTSFCLCQLPTDLAPSSDELLRGWTR